jgi:hypothetical protein
MPDITMCHGKDCPLKEKCYRHRAIPGKLQSFFVNSPFKENECKYFWQIEKGELINAKVENANN